MAGLGRKVFEPLEFLSAADLNGYLMDQSVMVFTNAADRTAQIPTPTEGMMSYLKDTNAVEVYNGTAFVAIDTATTSINASQVVNTLTASTATAYSFVSSDQSKVLQFTAAGTVTATVGTATALSSGQRIDVIADGAAGVRIAAGAGVTFAGAGTAATTFRLGQFQAATILCVSSNAYRIIGNITAV